jgi:predicted nucleotidyltransferase
MPIVSRDELEAAAREVLAGQPWVAVAYLFGSVAQGRAGPLSDVDIGYVSGEPRSEDAAGRLLDRLVLRIGRSDVDLVDLRRAPFPLRFRAVRDGRVLVCGDELARERFEVESVLRYLDLKPLRDAALRIAAGGTGGDT